MSVRVLVTGAAGYIGAMAVRALAADERVDTVVAYDLQPAQNSDGVVAVRGDITADDLTALLREHRIDTVVHLASILKPPVGAPPDLARRVDVDGTARLLAACIETGVSHLVVTTSGASYGYHPDNPLWLTEEAPVRGHEAFEYSRNKRAVEELLVGIRGSDSPFVFIWDRDLINILVEGVLERRQGVFNLAGDGALTAREIARRMGKRYLPLPASLLAFALGLLKRLGLSAHGAETVDFLRYRPVLSNERLKTDFGYRPISSAAAFTVWLQDLEQPEDPAAPGDADKRPVVVVTGGAGGIGRALARRWSVAGARIALLDLDAQGLESAAQDLRASGADVMTAVLDITDYAACQAAMVDVAAHFGCIDVLVNNAGAVHRSAFRDTRVEVFRKVMEVNFFGSLHCAKAALSQLEQSRGQIVVISSIAGIAPLYGRTGYSASKHALHGLFESLRTELVDAGVGVLMVCPGFTRSPFEQHAMGGDGEPAGTKRSVTGRVAEPEEVADAVVCAAARGRRLLVLSVNGKLAYLLSRLAPGLYDRAMLRRLRTEGPVR
jgi:NAD(P)-dependent dehydrogenase (short-subunit alcohol dehydrogenase family)